jgi:hypothetical protein
LAKARDFDWRAVLRELFEQERLIGQHFCHAVLESMEFVIEQLGVKVPVYRELLNHATDFAIVRVLQLKCKKMSIVEIAKSIGDVKEYEVRRRLQQLRKKKAVSAFTASGGRNVYGLGRNADAFMRSEL